MARPGVGFRIRQGAESLIEESGGMGKKLAHPFDLSVSPFNAEGTRMNGNNDEIRRLLIQRYKGGKDEYAAYVPQGDYAEMRWRPVAILTAMYKAWKSGQDITDAGAFFFMGNPDDWTGVPTLQEETDFAYAIPRRVSESMYRRYASFMDDGSEQSTQGTPTKPTRREPNTVSPVVPTPPSTTAPTTMDLANLLQEIYKGVVTLDNAFKANEQRLAKMEKQLRQLLTRTKNL